MKNQKKCRKGIYRLALLLTVLCSAVGGYAQTQDDLKLVDPGGFKLCNGDAVNGQKLTVYNQCVHEGFKKGTFKVDWGDGSAVEEWGTEETMEHVYREFKVFKLKFSWTSSDGSKVLEKNYDVLRLNKPDVALKVNEKGTCYGMESEIKIIDYDKQTSGTVYVVNFGDGRDTTLTQAEMMKTMGSVKHTFQTDNCPITVELEARNECSDYMLPLQTTVTTAVVIPPEAAFDFVAPGCTGYPVQVINRTIEGRDVYCNTIAEYIWKFGDKPSVFEKYPQVIFDTPGEYEVRLIASTGGLECSNDTIVKVISVIQSPEVGFTVDRDTVCSGESVVFTDHSKGENPQYYWNVTGRQTNDFVFINGTSEKSENPVIQFNGYGEYVVALTLTNECPQNVKDTTIIVRKDPEIVEVTWPVSLCPDLTTGKALVNLENYFRLYWNGNPKEAVWKIEPKAGMTGTVDFLPGYEADKEYPQVYLQAGATYEVSLTLNGASVGGVLCGDPSKLTIHKELKIDDPAITDNIVPTPAPVGDNISICDGETVSFENHSNGEGLEHSWTIKPITTELYDPAWNVEYLAGSPTSAEPRIRFNGYGDFEVTDSLSVPCNSKRISFRVHVRKDPTIFLADFPTEICPRDVLNTELCIFYEWYNHVPEAHWEFTPDRVDFVDGTSSDSPEPKIHFQESGKYTYKVTLPEVGCPEKDEHGGILTRKELTGELKVRISGLDVTVKEKDNRDEVCEGGMLIFTNSASEKDPESLELAYNWEVTIPETGEPQGGTAEDCEFLKGNTEKVAPITFKKWGTYEVTGTVFGFCDTVSRTLRIRVKKNPEVVLEDTVSCPAGFVLSGDTTFVWYNNTPQVTWQIYRQDGTDQPGDYELGAEGLTSLIPRVEFKRPGYYTVKATLPHAGCPATDPVAEAVYHIYDPDIYGDIVIKTPVAGNPSVADICEQEIVVFENTMQEEAGALSWEWEVVSDVEQGYEYMQDGQVIDPAVGSRQKAPSIRFTKYGEYRVRVATHSTCKSPVTKEFRVVVHGIPDIELASYMKRVCAGDGIPVEMSDYLKWVDTRNSALTSKWTITPEVGWSWKGGDRENTDFPGILFNDNGHYELKLEVFSKCADEGKQEFLTEVNVLRTEQQASFSVGKDSVGCTDDPDPFVITLNNLSEGDSLAYTWTVTPQQGVSFAEGDTNSESPKLLFSEPGDYDVRLAVSNGCHHDDDSVFRIKAFAIPRVRIGDIADQCEPFHFIGRERVEVDQRNDKIQQVHWTITANQGYASEGYTLVNGTDLKSYYPDIDFKTCDYTVVAAYKNRCKTPGQAVFQVKVDKFIPVIPLPDDTICELAEARILRAQPEGGWWTLKDPAIPEAAEVLYTEWGNSYFYPGFDPYAQKDIGLVYHYRNGACIARDTMNMRIWPLPYVEAGDSLKMCLNNPPVTLVGRDSAAGQVWQPNRGDWKSGQDVLAGHLFTPTVPGDFQLLYYYTDSRGCMNRDSAVMRVHPLPSTDFTVAPQSCIHTDVLFTPAQPDGNTFEWIFGDDTPHGISDNEILHSYDMYGYRDVICMAQSVYGCRDTSEATRIEIINLPPPPFFDVDTLQGCAPFEVLFTVDPDTYKSDHNYLTFHWDYGDGTKTDTLMPIVPKPYPAGSWDTTFVARMTVSNVCDTVSYDTTITVFSAPKVSFALMHEWECSPVFLELQNTTTGNNCVFNWTFTNSRTGEVVGETDIRNPEHEFTTDETATSYFITLRAENRCDVDEYTDTLLVKPRQISAHFTPLDNPYACVNQEILFRNNSTDTVSTILNTYWNFGDGSRDTVWSPRHKYDKQGTYLVKLKIDNGCGWDTISSPVIIYPLPHLEIKSEDYLCEADTFTFVVNSDQELKQVTWKLGDGQTGNKDSLRYVYEGYGTFPVTVIGVSAEINQCTDSVMKEVVVYNKPILTIEPVDTIQCSPYLYQPEITGEAYLMWDYGDRSGLTSAREHWYVNESDTVQRFRVMIYAETDKGCKSEYLRGVVVPNKPRALLDKKVEKGNPQKVTFINLSEECSDCIWNLPDKGTFHAFGDQTVEFGEQGVYRAELVVENVYGCRDTAIMEHRVLIKGLYFPNTFIPHSQNPKINRFNGIGMGLARYRLQIFDQYGNKIWETRALENGRPSEGWDGCNLKGERMPQGMYIWRAEAIFGDAEVWTGDNNESGVPETTQGTVLLLRE